eukprot:TRINITY_DN5922_c0_g1_i4.p1 TRINITY_DN5922_c0_g1~~TRINITY_DN5922_c0_g1_i4.p1  ORF type:complete len:112 (-),score=30.70 TRINITY_DN5922_c0_g1_i4:6-341(-)
MEKLRKSVSRLFCQTLKDLQDLCGAHTQLLQQRPAEARRAFEKERMRQICLLRELKEELEWVLWMRETRIRRIRSFRSAIQRIRESHEILGKKVRRRMLELEESAEKNVGA